MIPCSLLTLSSGKTAAKFSDSGLQGANLEALTLLYPLHQALVASLGFLCTTSLLPSELELLSVALVNLLLFSTSPQAVILQALLWIGGVTLYILCKHVLRWTVDLARVPSWRFRPSRHASRGRHVAFRAIDDSLGGILSKHFGSRNNNNSSDSDSGQNSAIRKRRLKVRSFAAPRDTKPGHEFSLPRAAARTVAADDIGHLPTAKAEEKINSAHSASGLHRRHTLPTHLSDTVHKVGPKHSVSGSRVARPKSFRSLTHAQATILKWLYSLYVYLIVAATILFPIRTYIGQRALQNSEPVGWALGYLLGDLPAFRLQTVMWNLEGWICLPRRVDHQNLRVCRGEYLRRVTLGASNTRLLTCAYCIACITAGLVVVFRLSAVVEVDTRRKVFHGMMVAMFLPTIFVDPPFIALAFALILSIFLLLDLFRASQLPPISKPLTYFLAPYVDGRDHRGPIIVSHVFLLIGCAIPLWLSLAATPRDGIRPFGGWDAMNRDMSMVSGVVCVGMGDAAASLIGRRYGRRRWPWSGGKSLEGSLAFAVAVVVGLAAARAWLLLGGWDGDSGDKWAVTLGKASIAAAISSLTEAVLTGGNDNVIVPVILWLLVRGLKI
jgi:dolichol kinase